MRNTSLYVAKADGTREVLDEVTFQMAREIFSTLNWMPELETFEAAMAEGREGFVPEFGLDDDEQRRLGISAVGPETVSFSFQSGEEWCGVSALPNSEVATLLRCYFAGSDD